MQGGSFGGGYGARSGGYDPQEYGSHGGYSQGGPHAQGSTGYGTHAYGGQSSGQSMQSGYGAQGGYGSQGGYGPQGAQQSEYGGYGAQGGGYGSQGSYASHGGYGSQAGGPRRGPKGYQRSDERIRDDICEHLWHRTHIDASDVTVEVSGGRVVLEGTVPVRRMKHEIEDIADACAGVSDVENRVRVSQAPGNREGDSAGGTGSSGMSGSSSFGSASGSSVEAGKPSTASRGAGGSGGVAGQSTSSKA